VRGKREREVVKAKEYDRRRDGSLSNKKGQEREREEIRVNEIGVI